MPLDKIVSGQRVQEAKVERAKELRRQMTSAEAILWKQLRTNRLNGLHFRRQQVIDGFIVDFYCHQAELVVEVDGGIHEDQEEYDFERDRILEAHGLRVLRIGNWEIERNLWGVLERIEREALSRTKV